MSSPVVNDGNWERTPDLSFIAAEAYEVVLRYDDIFDNPFRTVHPCGFPQDIQTVLAALGGDRTKQQKLATQQNKATPFFLPGKQTWRTLADMAPIMSDTGVSDLSTGT